MSQSKLEINTLLAKRLVASQFPNWKDLPIYPVASSGWDNRSFHLGDEMLIRIPSSADYALQVEKEHYWLPKLSGSLPLKIPTPLRLGYPDHGYPWNWSIYSWIDGASACLKNIKDLNDFASALAQFLKAFESIDASLGPPPGLHSFYRGSPLKTYNTEVRRAIEALQNKTDSKALTAIWEQALASENEKKPVWVHGDLSPGNLLVADGKLVAVIDFGQLTVGDPACDLVIAWNLFFKESRALFRKSLDLDEKTWMRAKGWALWKALIAAAGFVNPGNFESNRCWQIIQEILEDE
jgi:aminoglycoside phosphotransferase (APT) family kinase protein